MGEVALLTDGGRMWNWLNLPLRFGVDSQYASEVLFLPGLQAHDR